MKSIKRIICGVLSFAMAFTMYTSFAQVTVFADEGNKTVTMSAGDVYDFASWSGMTSEEMKGLTFASSDQTVARVDEKGMLKALKSGEITVTATGSDGNIRNFPVNVSAYDDGSQIVGSLTIVARFNDEMNIYDGHTYLVFTSYQDGIQFDTSNVYAAYNIDDSYYTDIAADAGNGSWRTGTETDKYFTFMDKSNLPEYMTVNRGEVITIGNYRDFNMSISDAVAGTVVNSSIWAELSDEDKTKIKNGILLLLNTEDALERASVLSELSSILGVKDLNELKTKLDGIVAGGICYNRELYNQKLEYDQFENVTYTVGITKNQLEKMQSKMSEYHDFSILNNSCATVTVGIWNAALGENSAYALTDNGTGFYSVLEMPKFVRESIESNLPGYKINKLNSVEDTDAMAITGGDSYYVTKPSTVSLDYTADKNNNLSIYTKQTSLRSLRDAGIETEITTYPKDNVEYVYKIDSKVTNLKNKQIQYEINSITFSACGTEVSKLENTTYSEGAWFTANVNYECEVVDQNGTKIKSVYDEANHQVHFKVTTFPATCIIKAKENTVAENSILLNSSLKGSAGKKTVTVKWGTVKDADKYVLYGAYCGKGNTYKKIKTTTSTTFTVKKLNGKALNAKKTFKFYVVAMKDGKAIGKSVTIHVSGSQNTKYSNVKSVSVAKTSVSVKVGKTSKIKASLKLKNSKKKLLGHVAKFRYKSGNTSVATVTSKGVIKGVSKGTAVIYVYSTNGIAKKVKVTVK